MPLSIAERPGSRVWNIAANEQSSTIELLYIVNGTDDAGAFYAAEATSPAYYGGLKRDTISVEPTDNNLTWHVNVTYKSEARQQSQPPSETGDTLISFDTGGATQHITQALGTTKYAKSGETAADFKDAIGVTPDGTVQGVDIPIPSLTFEVTKYLESSVVSDDYVRGLAGATGKVNSKAYRGFDAGELQFLGATGSKRPQGDWEVRFKFKFSENLTNQTIGEITGVAKRGHQYIWVYYSDEDDSTADAVVQRPKYVYVQDLVESKDFEAVLQI